MKIFSKICSLFNMFFVLFIGISHADTVIQKGDCEYANYRGSQPHAVTWSLALADNNRDLRYSLTVGGARVNLFSPAVVSNGFIKINGEDTQIYALTGAQDITFFDNNTAQLLTVPHKKGDSSNVRAKDIISIIRADKEVASSHNQLWSLFYNKQGKLNIIKSKVDLACEVASAIDPSTAKDEKDAQ